jgi:hypothetical protein
MKPFPPHWQGDPEAYRRDRRKDALLQENGYRASASSQKTSANV